MMTDSGETRGANCVMGDFLRRHWVKSLVTGACIGLMVNLCLLHYLERPAAAGGGLVSAGVPLASHVDFDLLEMLGEVIEPDEDVLEVVVGEFGDAVFGAMSGAAAEALRGLNGAYELIFERSREANELFMFVHLPVLEVGAIGELHAGEGEIVPVALRAWTDRFDQLAVADLAGLPGAGVEDVFGDTVRFVTLEVTTAEGDGVLAGLVRPMLDGDGVLMGALLPLSVERVNPGADEPTGDEPVQGGDFNATSGQGGGTSPIYDTTSTNVTQGNTEGDSQPIGSSWIPSEGETPVPVFAALLLPVIGIGIGLIGIGVAFYLDDQACRSSIEACQARYSQWWATHCSNVCWLLHGDPGGPLQAYNECIACCFAWSQHDQDGCRVLGNCGKNQNKPESAVKRDAELFCLP